LKTGNLNKFIYFDNKSGTVECEAGVLLKDLQSVAISRGWFLPITPGTQYISVGGAIANDVHGKNHHLRGSFGHFLKKVTIIRTDGSSYECSADKNSELFFATIGGLGLTGVIYKATIQLIPKLSPLVEVETLAFKGVKDFLNLSNDSYRNWEYSASWVDCLSGKNFNGVYFRANHLDPEFGEFKSKSQFNYPFNNKASLINKTTLKIFNTVYYQLNRIKKNKKVLSYDAFLYPLDFLGNWNKLYGENGFYQFQNVVPNEAAENAIELILQEISRSKQGSFLAVLKKFGSISSIGMLSFPREGVTLALDFPNYGSKTIKLLKRLEIITLEAGGTIYPAKDMVMGSEIFKFGYPSLSRFLNHRDPGISSNLSRRLMGF
jgi:FAD/FMN-containing dehydrogenase